MVATPMNPPQNRPAMMARGGGKKKDVEILNSSLDVNMQDATNPLVILPMVHTLGTTTLAVSAIIDSYTVQVTTSAGMTIGNHLRVINPVGDRYYFGTIIAIAGATLTVDSPVDYGYLAGSEVTFNTTNMNVDGSVTPVHFHLRTGSPSIPSAIDITRMIMICTCTDPVALSYFGDQPRLTRGLLFRKQHSSGDLRNYWNVKDNIALAGIAYDWSPYEVTKQTDGLNGFSWRLTFGTSAKLGAVIRVEADEQLGVLIQDDLSSLTNLTVVLEGHVTVGE